MQPCTAMGMGENGKKKMGKAALSYLLCQGEPCWSIPSQKQLSLFWNVLSSLQHIPPFPEVCLLSHIPVCSCCSHSLSKPWQSCCEWHRCVLSSLEGLRATFWEEEGAPGCGRNGWDGSSSARNGMEFASGLMERLCLGWNPPQGTLARGGGTKIRNSVLLLTFMETFPQNCPQVPKTPGWRGPCAASWSCELQEIWDPFLPWMSTESRGACADPCSSTTTWKSLAWVRL